MGADDGGKLGTGRMDWKLTADVCSFLSGLALSWPALRLNQCLREARQLQKKAETDRSKVLADFRRGLATAYTDPNWNRLDHYLTIGGVGLFILASTVELFLVR